MDKSFTGINREVLAPVSLFDQGCQLWAGIVHARSFFGSKHSRVAQSRGGPPNFARADIIPRPNRVR